MVFLVEKNLSDAQAQEELKTYRDTKLIPILKALTYIATEAKGVGWGTDIAEAKQYIEAIEAHNDRLDKITASDKEKQSKAYHSAIQKEIKSFSPTLKVAFNFSKEHLNAVKEIATKIWNDIKSADGDERYVFTNSERDWFIFAYRGAFKQGLFDKDFNAKMKKAHETIWNFFHGYKKGSAADYRKGYTK